MILLLIIKLSSNQPAHVAAQPSSSLVSVRYFSAVDDVVNSFAPHITDEVVVVVAEIVTDVKAASDDFSMPPIN